MNARRTGLLLAAAALVGAACGDGSSDAVAERMSAHLADRGADGLAEQLTDSEAGSLTLQDRPPYLEEWDLYELTFDTVSHRVFTDLATSEHDTLTLNGRPEAFETLLRSDPGTIADAETALAAGRDYLRLTAERHTDTWFHLLGSADDVEVTGSREAEVRPHIDAEIGQVVEPPQVTEDDGAFVVTAYTQVVWEVQRRTVTLHPDGTIDDEAETLLNLDDPQAEPSS